MINIILGRREKERHFRLLGKYQLSNGKLSHSLNDIFYISYECFISFVKIDKDYIKNNDYCYLFSEYDTSNFFENFSGNHIDWIIFSEKSPKELWNKIEEYKLLQEII